MSKQEDNLQNKFTYCELREIWPALKKYVDHTYTKHLSTSGRIDIMKRWIHFYSKEDFTKEETLLEIEDYSPTHPEEKEKHCRPDDQPGDRDRWKNQDLQQTLRSKIIPEKSKCNCSPHQGR